VTYAVVVSRAHIEGTVTELYVVAVHQGLELADAMRLLGERPAGTVGRIQRLPAALPEVGEVLRHDARGQVTFNPAPSRRGDRP
jgi:hypothetical protein